MAYTVDSNGDLIIGGFQAGIGDSPYSGLSDARSVNLVSVPGEASVNFATSNTASGAVTGSVTSVAANVLTATIVGTMENYIAIYFTSVGSYSGISLSTPYWVGNLSGSTFKIYSDYNQTSVVTVTGSGTAAFIAYQVNIKPSYVTGGASGGATGLNGIQYFDQPTNVNDNVQANYFTFGVDGFGQVWSNMKVTGTHSFWTYTGNYITDGTGGVGDAGVSNASGNGLVYWRVSDNAGSTSTKKVDYLFVFRNSQIDYFIVQNNNSLPNGVWNYGWNPSNGTNGGVNSPYLTVSPASNQSHASIVGPDNRVYFCDGNNIGKFFQTAAGTLFVPGTPSTYTQFAVAGSEFNILPANDVAQCIAPLGTGYLIGGQGKVVYQWDSTSNLASGYIPVAEPYISKIVTVNVNAYIFAGNRGRIYITNGSQADLWKKIPDHLSGSVEPRFTWGGATGTRNQLYFSFMVTDNSGNTITTMGGLWAIDLNSGIARITNQLSYGTYAGYANAIIGKVYNPVNATVPTENTLFIGWYNGVSLSGIDQPSTNPYTNGASWVTSDMIPIGTAIKPTTPTQIEYKLSRPLVAGESVQINVGKYFDPSYSNFSNCKFNTASTSTAVGKIADITDGFPIQEFQWLVVQGIITSTNTTPSYVRITEMRVHGATVRQSGLYNLS